jgi:hypothetical protein
VADLNGFLAGLAAVVAADGVVAAEIHYSARIIRELQYDSIYHEHLGYFTFQTMEAAFRRHGLHVFDVAESPISGGSLVLYLRKGTNLVAPAVKTLRDSEQALELNSLEAWRQFAQDASKHKASLRTCLEDRKKTGHKIVGYGASARSSTLLNFCGINKDTISAIADQNPLKHAKYTAGSHIPIRSPEAVLGTDPNVVVILGWNFYDEIKDLLLNRFGYSGRIIRPLPTSVQEMRI